MTEIKKKLVSLGLKVKKSCSAPSNNIPDKIRDIVLQYEHSILFNRDVVFTPLYKTGFEDDEGSLPLEALWGVDEGEMNIFNANSRLMNVDAENHLFSLGSCFSGSHLCVSKDDGSVYIFANGYDEPCKKIFDTVLQLFDALKVAPSLSSSKKSTAKSVDLKF